MSDATVPPFTVRDWGDFYRHGDPTEEAARRGGDHHQKESHR